MGCFAVGAVPNVSGHGMRVRYGLVKASSTIVLRVGAAACVVLALGCGGGGPANDAGGPDAPGDAGSEVGDTPSVPDAGDARDDAAVAPDGAAPDVVGQPEVGGDVTDAAPGTDVSSDATDAGGVDTRDAGGISLTCRWVGDFDGDGVADCARLRTSASNQRDLVFNKGVGPGAYSPTEVATPNVLPTVRGVPAPADVQDLAIFDVDHDGRQDIIVWYPDQDPVQFGEYLWLRQLRGGADGTFTPSEKYLRQWGIATGGKTGDVDGDGKLDLICLSYDRALYATVSYLVLTGDLAIQSPAFMARGGGTLEGVGDINGDGKLDAVSFVQANVLAAPMSVRYVGVSYGKGNGTFDAIVAIAGTEGAATASVKDANDDGELDVLFTLAAGSPSKTLYGDGAGNFSATPP